MAKKQSAVESSAESAAEEMIPEVKAAPAAKKAPSGEPELFDECREAFGNDVEHWPIWARNEYKAYKDGAGPRPEGGLPPELKKS